ncbi:MAG: ornithine--oxo-acid transaminase [bacterium]
MNAQFYIDLEKQYGANNYLPLDIVIQKAEGIWVWDVEGKKYLDFLSAYSAVNQGHCHPRIVNALIEQVKTVTLTSRAFRTDQLGLYCKELTALTGMDLVLPMNSGAEAVETAIKASRKWGYTKKGVPEGKAEIIVCENNFAGRTTTIVGFSSEAQYRRGFGPFTPGFKSIPFGDAKALAGAINENTVAFMVEPIQGEGGIIIPPTGYLNDARQICTENNVIFYLDEIQTGLGRTGKLFAYQHEINAKPDLLTVGKALSGGFYPVSAAIGTKEILGVFDPGDHGSTFGGNPLACAVAREALKVLVDEKLADNSAKLGHYFMEMLRTIDSKHIKEVRGKGLFIGIELKDEAGGARRFCEALADKGLLCKETHENVIRFAPPLVIEKEDIDWAFGKIKRVLEEMP